MKAVRMTQLTLVKWMEFIVALLYGEETELPGPRWLTMLSTNESQEAVHLQKQCLLLTESSILTKVRIM